MAKQINISNEAVEMLAQIAGPQGSWSDKIVRVSTMSGHNGSYFIRQYLETLGKIYPQLAEVIKPFQELLLTLYQLENNQFLDPIAFNEIVDTIIGRMESFKNQVDETVKKYERKKYRDPIDK